LSPRRARPPRSKPPSKLTSAPTMPIPNPSARPSPPMTSSPPSNASAREHSKPTDCSGLQHQDISPPRQPGALATPRASRFAAEPNQRVV
jgi:hypothetical protein